MASPFTILFERNGSSPDVVESVVFGAGDSDVRSWIPVETAPLKTAATPPQDVAPIEAVSQDALAAAELESQREAALAAAYQQGLDDGMATAETHVQANAERLADGLDQLRALHSELNRVYREESIELAIELARAVVGHTMTHDADALGVVLERALTAVPRTDEVLVRLNPDDLADAQERAAELSARRGDPVALRMVASPSMERGGCILEFDEGAVDARPSVALDALREALESALAGARYEMFESNMPGDND